MDWIEINDQMPAHMQEIRVWIESKSGGYERKNNAVYLAFDGNIYDADEQTVVNYVTKWKPLPSKDSIDDEPKE